MNAPVTTMPDRTRFLGGSDAAAVMGLSPWATPVELWQQKTGRVPREEPDAAALKRYERGHRLEPFIREMAVEKLRAMGLDVELIAINQRYVDPEHEFLSCEIDFELLLTGEVAIGGKPVVFDREHINADAKSVTGFARKKWGEEDSEDVPIEYAAQFMHGLMVTSRRYCLVAALRSFDDVEIFWVVRDDETIAGMRPKLVSFWRDHVLGDTPPDTYKFSDIKLLFPLDNGQAVDATQDVADMVLRLQTTKAEIKRLEEIEESLSFHIANFISPHAVLRFAGKEIATWKAQNDTRVSNELLAAAEIYTRADDGTYTRIPDPVSAFKRTKAIRVLRLKKGKSE